MAEIVELQAFENQRPRRRNVVGTAEVVIFPGVRIERTGINLADRLMRPKRAMLNTRARNRRSTLDE